MTILGLGQIVLDHPEARSELLPAMQSAADRLVDPQTLAYAASVYGRHGISGMRPGEVTPTSVTSTSPSACCARSIRRRATPGCTIG
jgi:hypothetical protein